VVEETKAYYGLVWLVVAWRLASTMKVLDSPSLEIYGLPIGIIIIIIIWILKKWYLYVILRVFYLCGGNQCWVGTRYPTLARKEMNRNRI
jgi:uncharacterized membrane protein